MKKITLLGLAIILSACSDLSALSGGNTASDSTKAKMQSCLLMEGNSRFQAGTLFTQGIKATAKDMVSTCMKKLALESMGISAESQTAAENIIANLQSLRSAQ